MRFRMLVCACIAATAPALAAESQPPQHPLFAYLQRLDASYSWSKEAEEPLPLGGTATRLRMTSQTWQGIPWTHALEVFRPAKAEQGATALLLITGGHGDAQTRLMLGMAAHRLGIPTAVLWDIPNQPLFEGRREDALIAYTLQEYVRTRDASWPLLYPMTKSAIRAMDTIQKLAASEWKTPINGFVVTGASKRGWTTWFTGAADKRVVGIAPMVYDNLNVARQMDQQIANYGKYSEQIHDYSAAGLLDMLASPEGRQVSGMIDPFVLRSRLTMPKLLINGSNDPYWTLESANLYWNDLLGDKHILYVPNAGHGLVAERGEGAGDFQIVLNAIGAFAKACASGQTLPPVAWQYTPGEKELALRIQPAGQPEKVLVWTATSPTKDFRQAEWHSQELTAADGAYSYVLPKPATGHAAVFGEVRYRAEGIGFSQSTTPRME